MGKGGFIDQLFAVVIEPLTVRDKQIAGLELVLDLHQDRQLEVLAVHPSGSERIGPLTEHMLAPGFGHPLEVLLIQAQGRHLNQFMAPVAQGQHGRNQRFHARVLTGGAQGHQLQAVEQQRSDHAVRLQHERQIVAAGISHMLIALGQQRGHLRAQAAADGVHTLAVAALQLECLQDVLELANQVIGALGVFELVGDQLLLGQVLQTAHLLDEQFGGVIQRLGILGANEDGRQGVSFLFGQFGQLTGVQGTCHSPELLELGYRHLNGRQLIGQLLQHADVLQVGPDLLVGGTPGLTFEGLPAGETRPLLGLE